jgi:hypothetical protein
MKYIGMTPETLAQTLDHCHRASGPHAKMLPNYLARATDARESYLREAVVDVDRVVEAKVDVEARDRLHLSVAQVERWQAISACGTCTGTCRYAQVHSRFSRRREWLLLFGMTAIPRFVAL